MEVKSLKSTKIYFHAVLRIILSRGQDKFKTFQKWKKNWKRKRTNSNHVRYRNRHNQSQAKALVLSAILNTWLPRSDFIHINNTLLTAGCC